MTLSTIHILWREIQVIRSEKFIVFHLQRCRADPVPVPRVSPRLTERKEVLPPILGVGREAHEVVEGEVPLQRRLLLLHGLDQRLGRLHLHRLGQEYALDLVNGGFESALGCGRIDR